MRTQGAYKAYRIGGVCGSFLEGVMGREEEYECGNYILSPEKPAGIGLAKASPTGHFGSLLIREILKGSLGQCIAGRLYTLTQFYMLVSVYK